MMIRIELIVTVCSLEAVHIFLKIDEEPDEIIINVAIAIVAIITVIRDKL